MTKAQEKAAAVLANKRQAFARKVATLTGHVFGRIDRAALNAAFDAIPTNGDYVATAEAFAAEVAALEPVGRALHPQKVEAVARARQYAEETIAAVKADLEANGMKINAVAPRARYNDYSRGREAINAKHSLYSSLTEGNDEVNGYSVRCDHADYVVKMSARYIARFIENNERDAALQYDSFICKMVAKIGEGAVEAEIKGTHIWGYSFLTVVMADDSKEVWKTQQIVNVSKLGRLFNQWPSRKMK